MNTEIDWRHIVAATLAVGLILYGGFRLMTARPEQPNAKVVAGPNARLEDAPEHPPANTGWPQGAAAGGVQAGFPTGR